MGMWNVDRGWYVGRRSQVYLLERGHECLCMVMGEGWMDVLAGVNQYTILEGWFIISKG